MTLRAYLDAKKEQERLNRRLVEVDSTIAIKKKELQELEEQRWDLVQLTRENGDVMRKIEAEAS